MERISFFVTVSHEGVICNSAGSLPSLPRPSHPPPWAAEEGEPVPRFQLVRCFPHYGMEMLTYRCLIFAQWTRAGNRKNTVSEAGLWCRKCGFIWKIARRGVLL